MSTRVSIHEIRNVGCGRRVDGLRDQISLIEVLDTQGICWDQLNYSFGSLTRSSLDRHCRSFCFECTRSRKSFSKHSQSVSSISGSLISCCQIFLAVQSPDIQTRVPCVHGGLTHQQCNLRIQISKRCFSRRSVVNSGPGSSFAVQNTTLAFLLLTA